MRDSLFSVAAGFLGWTLDAFDFFLVVIALPHIAADFHVGEKVIALSLTLTLVFRPAGAFLFGLLADRYGRRVPMMIDLVFYSAVEVATAFAPSLTAFLILRALFGIGMGGEWGVGATLVMEKVPPRFRGLLGGVLQEGYAAGYLLSAVAAYFLLDRFGWRPMFLLGGIPALLALLIRFFVKESEVWEKKKAASWGDLFKGVGRNTKLWLYLTCFMAMMNFASHGTQDMYPTFMKHYRGMAASGYSTIVILMMVGAIVGGILFGYISDRLGRRRTTIVAFTGALLTVPLWALSSTASSMVAGAFLMQFFVQGAWGVVPAYLTELSPDSVRGFLPGFAYQCGNLLAAGIGWLQASSAEHFAYPLVMAGSAGVIFLGAILVTAKGGEKRGVVFGES